MEKRGISPLIVSVILVGVTIAMAGFIYYWISNATVESQRYSGPIFIDFEMRKLADCEDFGGECVSDNSDAYYCLLIENKENFDVWYKVKTVGKNGISISDECSPSLGPYDAEIFRVGYNSNIGELDYAQVIPYTYE
jgi:flagellin-like protein